MSDSKPHGEHEGVPSGNASRPTTTSPDQPGDDPDLDLEDLDDLDTLGVDGLVDKLTAAEDDDDVAGRRRPRRTPLISFGVIAVSVYLLVTMWLDFRYWLEPEQPVDLGHATEFVGPQGVPSGHHGRYVVLEGTPDVQNALRGATRERYVGYLRITEGGGQLFAAVPRDKDESVDSRFAGRYAGRMLRLGSAPAYPWLEQYFAAENVVETVDASADALAEALRGASDDGLTVETERGPVHLLPQGRVWLVVRRAVARVQLGAESFRNADQAEAAVAQLGYPYLREAGSPTMPFHRFTVKIPEDARDAAERKLLGMLEQAPDPTDPKEGVSVLPMTATYGVPVDQLRLAGDTLVFPPGDNTSSPGYDVQGDRLVERPTEDKPMELPVSRVHAVRLDDPVTIDPDGYLIVVGAAPSSERIAGLAWLLVLGIALANVGSVAMAVRRRR